MKEGAEGPTNADVQHDPQYSGIRNPQQEVTINSLQLLPGTGYGLVATCVFPGHPLGSFLLSTGSRPFARIPRQLR